MLNAPQDQGATANAFLPPDFTHSPITGQTLIRPVSPPGKIWIPPYGTTPADADRRQSRDVRGLRQTTVSLAPRSTEGMSLAPENDAPFALSIPQPGEYEFISGRFHTECDVLVAIDVRHGAFFAWFPAVAQWQRIDHAGGGTLAEIKCIGDSFGMETTQRGNVTELILPTAEGMAIVDLDAVSLTFEVVYRGDGIAMGAPIWWANEVRLPVCDAEGQSFLVSLSSPPIALPVPLGVRFAPPICNSGQMIWRADKGQLVVRKNPAGTLHAQWFDWPAGLSAEFAFGCPFLSTSGSFWQLAFETTAQEGGHYLYLQLGHAEAERHVLDSPRFCTGTVSFRQAERIKGNPWSEAEHAGDVGSDELIVPLLESTQRAGVLSLLIKSTQGVGILESRTDRPQAVLQYQADNVADQLFFTPQVPQPWRIRAFIHDARLWIYHPELPRIHGWPVES